MGRKGKKKQTTPEQGEPSGQQSSASQNLQSSSSTSTIGEKKQETSRTGGKKQTIENQGGPSGQQSSASQNLQSTSTTSTIREKKQESSRTSGDQPKSEEWITKSNKGKKQTTQDQGGPSGQQSSASQNLQSTSTTSTVGEKKQESSRISGDQPKSEEWITKSNKGDTREQRKSPGDTGDQPGFQKRDQPKAERGDQLGQHEQQRSRSGQQRYDRGQQQWRSQGPEQFRDKERQKGPGGQQGQIEKGRYGQQGSRSGQQRYGGGQQQWHNKEQGQLRDKGQTGDWEQQRQIEKRHQQLGSSSRQPQYDRGQQQSRSQAQDQLRYQERQTHPWGQQGRIEKQQPKMQDTTQQTQSPKLAKEASTVWQNKQMSEKVDSQKPQQSQGAEGAPDKVQLASSSTSKSPSQKSSPSTSQEPITALTPVYKEPGTLARKKIMVQSNHFALDLGQLKEAYHYDVTIEEFDSNKQKQSEESPNKDKNKGKVSKGRKIKNKVQFKVLHNFLEKHFPDRYPSFDGEKNLYTSKPLTNNLNDVLIDTDITVEDDLGRQKTFSIQIKEPNIISLVPQALADRRFPPMLTKTAIQCIDIVLRNAPIRNFTQIGPSFFTKPKNEIIELGGGMEMYYGFYQSVVTGGRPLLNVHLVHKAFPKNLPVLEAFIEVLKSKDKRIFTYADMTSLTPWQIKALNSHIKGLKVAYEVPGSTKVIYRVNELVGSPVQETMVDNSGVRRTILDYFRTEKKYIIENPDLPLLWVGNRNGKIKILVPPELCRIEKDQSVRRKMEDITSAMVQKAATSTKIHKKNTMERFKEANYNDSPCVREFGFSVNNKFEEMMARILPTPQLQYHEDSANVTRGTWQNKQFLVAKTIKKWAIIDISKDRYLDRSKINLFIRDLKNAATKCGINIESGPVFDTVKHRGFYPSKGDLELYFKDQKTKNYDIIFVIIPNLDQGKHIYSYVKGAAELTTGCLTQCVTARTVFNSRPDRPNLSAAINLLLKVNGKLDGVNHTFTSESKPKLLKEGTVMIMGADVTHPGPTAGDMPSIAAVIASHDPTAFQYNLCLRLQKPTMEYIVDLKNIVKEQLVFFFRKNNGAKPEKIIFFRDGVSEGQFAEVLHIELQAIKDACKEVQRDDYNPAITFLVVQKRHHTRFFPLYDKDSEDQDNVRLNKAGNYNVPAGTCVDTNIVNPTMQNFYLVSHASIKGVSRPTKYCTLYDDLDMSNDEIEELSYYLCHMFARCNRSVSYPAPTYYAHRGALRGKAYIKPALDENNFDMENLQKEEEKIQIQFNILENNPMFFI